jgi:hypothetical protein
VIKGQAKQHPQFRKACIGFAQFMHRTDVRLRMRIMGEKNIRVRPLNDAKAIDNGAAFLSESFIFSVAGGLILFESIRARRKELARRESVADDITALQDEIEWLKRQLANQDIIKEEYKLPENVKPTIILKEETAAAERKQQEQKQQQQKQDKPLDPPKDKE